MLEEGSFRNRSADFVMMFLFGGALMLVSLEKTKAYLDHQFFNRSFPFTVVRHLCQPVVPGAGLHHHAGVRVVAP